MQIIKDVFGNFYKLKENPYYQVLKNPRLYLYKIGVSTLAVGIVSLVINLFHLYLFPSANIPMGIHPLVGFLIAMLLVFRTNTAYDRWWEGRKMIANINAKFSFFVALINSYNIRDAFIIKNELRKFLNNTRDYLKDDKKNKINPNFHSMQMDILTGIIHLLRKNNKDGIIADHEFSLMNQCLNNIMESITSCERIKTTPIPFSYYIHIKLSIILYIITLPLSLFSDLGLWSTLVVMVLYFLISGVEIISNEIENPFSGEPNDLPIDSLIDNILETI